VVDAWWRGLPLEAMIQEPEPRLDIKPEPESDLELEPESEPG